MKARAFVALVVALLALAGGSPSPAQDKAVKPADLFRSFRELYDQGSYDVAAQYLKAYVATNPTDQDLLNLEAKYGTTTFTGLRNVRVWSDDPAAEKEARATVEKLITQARAANDKILRDPARLTKYSLNLAKTYEERIFAEQELVRAGDAAVPYVLDVFKAAPEDTNLSAAVTGLIRRQDRPSVAAWVAALDVLPPEQQYTVLTGMIGRPDGIALTNSADTDYVPRLWYLSSLPGEDFPQVKKVVRDWLVGLYGSGADRKLPEAELVGAARVFYDRKEKFLSGKPGATPATSTADLWMWDEKAQPMPKLVKKANVPLNQLEEYYGLKYARWALERNPAYEPAQQLIVSLAAERAVERGGGGELARIAPPVYQLLADTPTPVLADLLEQGLKQKRTALVLPLTRALAERSDRTTSVARPAAPTKAALLVRLMEYPDPRVQFAAATGLLRSPEPIDATLRGRVLEILKRAAAADPQVPPTANGQALIADPSRVRADAYAGVLKQLGYETEVFGSGKELLRRVKSASDFDLILIDHHIVYPQLVDVLTQLRVDLNAARRPVLVVASAEPPKLPSPRAQFLRFAILLALTEPITTKIPEPYAPDLGRRQTEDERSQEALLNRTQRDGAFQAAARARMDRLNRVIQLSNLQITPAQMYMLGLRVEQYTYAVLTAEYPLQRSNAPETFDRIAGLNRLIAEQPPAPPPGPASGFDGFATRIERFETDVFRNPELRKRYDAIRARIDLGPLGLAEETPRDRLAEARLQQETRGFPNVLVVPEPYSTVGFLDDVKTASDPGSPPRTQEEKRESAKAAVGWLSRMATGDVKGFDVKPAEGELRAALRQDDTASDAIDGVFRLSTAAAQQDLLSLALSATRPAPLRLKAADAAIRHIQAYTRLTPKTLADAVVEQVRTEQDPDIRGKLMVLKGMLAPSQDGFLNDLRSFPPAVVLPPPPPKEPAPAAAP